MAEHKKMKQSWTVEELEKLAPTTTK
jgi:hypothetical protein